MNNSDFGISLQEASNAFAELSRIAFQNLDVDTEVFMINQNPSLSKFQKRRLTKKLLKMKNN